MPTSCKWLLRHQKNHTFPCSIPVLDEVTGGLNPGQIIELCGPSSVGKSEICWSIIRDCLVSGNNAIVLSNKKIFIKDHNIDPSHQDNLEIKYVFCIYKFIELLENIDKMKVSLIVIDGLQTLVQSVLSSGQFQGQILMSSIKSLLSRLSVKSLIVYTNGLVSLGDGSHGPALGKSWETAPSARIMMLQEKDGTTRIWRNRDNSAILNITDHVINLYWAQ